MLRILGKRLYATKQPLPLALSAKRAAPDPIPVSSPELWTLNGKVSEPIVDTPTKDTLLDHPLYTPPARPDVSIGPLRSPLVFPQWDQRLPSSASSKLPSPPAWSDVPFDDAATAPIGDYPRITPQWSQLRDPFAYWDSQARRNYGEVLYDHDNFTEIFSIGPEMHWWHPFLGTLKTVGSIGFVAGLIYLWSPESHLWFASFSL